MKSTLNKSGVRIKSLCAFLPDAAASDSIPLLPEAVWNFLQALRRAAAVLQASDGCEGEISHLQSTESEQYPFSQVGCSCCCTQSREVAPVPEAGLCLGEDGWVCGMSIVGDVGTAFCNGKRFSGNPES